MDYDAVLFDLDGTLLDTIEDLVDSMNHALVRQGFPTRTVAEGKLFVGDGVEAFARRSLPQDDPDDLTLRRCIDDMRKDYVDRWAVKTRPYEGICELLDALVDRSVRMAVLSNKPDEFTKIMVAKFFGRWPFEVVRGALPNVPRKPDPAAAIRITDEMSIPPDRFLYVGDTNTDMKTGVAAGMYAVGVLWGFRDAAELNDNGARVLVDHPEDILDLLA